MKNYIYILLIFMAFGCSSEDKEENVVGSGVPQPFTFYFLVNKNSALYKNMVKEFSKNDYTHQPPENRGFNNVYFLKGDKRIKTNGFLPYNLTLFGSYMISLREDNILKNYGYFTNIYPLPEEILTTKKEKFYLVYGDKKILLEVKGKIVLTGGSEKPFVGARGSLQEFYVNNKKHKFINNSEGLSYNIVLYLEE